MFLFVRDCVRLQTWSSGLDLSRRCIGGIMHIYETSYVQISFADLK